MTAFHHDPLTLFLGGLLLCLLGGEVWGTLTAEEALRQGMSLSLRRLPGAWQSMAALAMALLALFVGHSDAVVLLLAAMMVLLGSKTGGVFCPFWGLPALVLYGLFPSMLGTILLLPVLLWPGQGKNITPQQRCVGVLLAVGLASHIHPAQPGTWLLGSCGIMLLLALWGYMKGWGALLSVVLTLRPLLLLGVLEAAQLEGLGASAQAAARALLLDMTLQVLGTVRPSWRALSLPIPPLPGFLVAWLGMHAALGLATGAAGWTIAGIGLALMVAALCVVEGVRLLPYRQKSVGSWAFMGCAWVLPSVVSLAGWAVLHQAGGLSEEHHIRDILWLFPGGDGAMMAFPALWILLGLAWLVVARRSTHGLVEGLLSTRSVSLAEQQGWAVWLMGETPYLTWRWRRYMVAGRWYWRWLEDHVRRFQAPLSEVGLTFWLLFLGGVLAVIGLTS